MIFDDCLSAVDANTEHAIAEILNNYLINKTAIVISHRVFPSFFFDQIVVMEEGVIIEQGNHQSLLQLNGYYAHLVETQASVDSND